MDLASAYGSIYQRMIDLASDLTDDEAATTVIPTPAWTVKDTYAHLVGAADDVMHQRLDGYGGDDWTAAQVSARSNVSLQGVCSEWTELLDDFCTFLGGSGDRYVGLVGGSWTHEQDIRGSLGLRGVGDTGGMEATLELLPRFAEPIDAARLDALRLDAGDRVWTIGSSSDVGATLHLNSYEAARLVFGRRSRNQVLAMAWDGDAAPYLDLLGAYGLAEVDITD